MKKISFNYKVRKFSFSVKRCCGIERATGLMFKSKNTFPLLFEFKKPTRMRIHSFFVFFPFIAVWLDEKKRVVDLKRIKPFTLAVLPKKPYQKLLEIPINRKNNEIVKLLVGD